MKALIVYYSLTGTTHKLAERMAGMLKCDIKRLSMFGRSVSIADNQYDIVIVGTPIWLYHPSFPASRFLSKNKKTLPDVAFFCTYQTTIGKSFDMMERKCGKKPARVLQMMGPEIGTEAGDQKLREYLEQLH
jgi:flavodoxin